MTITTTWIIEKIDCYAQFDGKTNVVFTIHWRVNGTDGAYTDTNYGTINVPYRTTDSTFTPYASLTQDQVLGWVKDTMGTAIVDDIEAGLGIRIAYLVNPPVISPALPWATV